MVKVKMNLEDDYNSGFSPIPKGEYEAYVYEIKAKTFKSGSEGFSIQFKIADGKYKKRVIFDNIVLMDKLKWKLGQFWQAVTGEKTELIDTDEFKNFVGRKVKLKVDIDTERDQNVVKDMSFIGGMQKPDAEVLGAFMDGESGGPIDINDGDLPF